MLLNCVRYYAVRVEDNLVEFGKIWMLWFLVMQSYAHHHRFFCCLATGFCINCWTSSRIVSLLVSFIFYRAGENGHDVMLKGMVRLRAGR